uniref:Uncharacterized protein n=1 Tax=Graphocephala atropunctata TaxID=36148 RepID=A0A1B6LN60_9HEMI
MAVDTQGFAYDQGASEAQSPGHGQAEHAPSTDQDKPALSTLASYSVGFANLGLKGAHLATRSRPPADEPAPPSSPLVGMVEKPALSALACHAIGFADLGPKK